MVPAKCGEKVSCSDSKSDGEVDGAGCTGSDRSGCERRSSVTSRAVRRQAAVIHGRQAVDEYASVRLVWRVRTVLVPMLPCSLQIGLWKSQSARFVLYSACCCWCWFE